MPLKNGNTVAVERRVDLASLFCMIGRHGPAVALAVVAMVSVLVGLVIYRTVRAKRRKATAAAAAAAAAGDGDGDGGSPARAEGDASVMRERYQQESTDVKEDVDLSPSDLRIRHRRAAAEKTRAPCSPPDSIRGPAVERTAADDAEEATHAEEANRSPRSDACMGDVVDCHPCESDDAIKEEEFRDSCLKEPEPINADKHEQGEEVECQEDEGMTPEEDVLEETTRQEENFQCALSDPVCFQQTSNMSENDNDNGLRDNKTTNCAGSKSDEPVIHTEDVPVPWFYSGKDEEFERENTDGIDFCNTRLSPEGESRNESEAAEELRLDHVLIGQPAEIQSSTFHRPSVTDEGTPPLRDSDWVEDGGPADGGVVRDDHWNKLDVPSAQFDQRAVEIEQKGGNGLTCDQEVGILEDGADQAMEKLPTGGNGEACSSSVTGWRTSVNADDLDGGTAGIAELSLDRQPKQKEDEEPNSPTLGPQMSSHKTEKQPENLRDGTAVVLAEEHIDQVLHRHVPSLYEDQQGIQTISNDASDHASAAADPDTAANSSQDQQSDQTKNNHEDFSEMTAGAAPVMTEVMNPPLCQIDLPSLEQFALRDNDIPCAGVGEESGISSMAASPEAGNRYEVIFENMVLPVMDYDLKSEGETEAQNSLFADDADISVIEEDTAGMEFEPSHRFQPPRSERAAWTIYESFASSQDMFGHEIEHNYHKTMDQFATQIADSVTCFTEKQSDMNIVVEKKGGSVEMKEAEEEKEEDYEKTEISIMEATMDHNEWIMDSNYQDFPWMNLSAPSFAVDDDTKSNQLPSEECQYSSAVADTTCTDNTDIPPTAEVKLNGTLSQLMAPNVDVTFSVHYSTQSPYQTVAVTGNQQELGNWKEFVPLEKAEDGHWATVVRLPAESHVEWKFVVVDKGEVRRWEECGNRLLHTGTGDELLVHECWARL